MAVGRITPIKGYDDLVRRITDDRLVIVGGAEKSKREYFERLKALAGDNVVFAGPQSKVPECLALADLVVAGNTVKPESFGLSVLEAYAMNKPVEARRFGGVAEIMESVEKYRAEHDGASNREAAMALYGSERFLQRTLEVYRSC